METLKTSEKVEKFLSGLGKPDNNRQQEQYDQLLTLEFPTTKDEYWKYTRVGKITNSSFHLPEKKSENLDLSDWIITENYLVIENGFVRNDLSNPGNEYSIEELEAGYSSIVPLNEKEIFTSLNSTYFNRAVWIHINEKQQCKSELQLIFLGSENNAIINTRTYITAAKSSEAEIIQTFINTAEDTFTNAVLQAHIDENAKLKVHTIQNEDATSSHIQTSEAIQEDSSSFHLNTFSLDGLLIRNNVNIAVKGQNCETQMNGAVIGKGKMHVDNHTFVDHLVSNCFSNENYKYVLDEKSRGVFNGKVVVRQDAQKINAYQNNGNVLLSDDAEVDSKPELEIYADDVKCSHGSTTGQLDEDALFYLGTRGISKDKAKKMLVAAFIQEVLEDIKNENVTGLIHEQLRKKHGWNF